MKNIVTAQCLLLVLVACSNRPEPVSANSPRNATESAVEASEPVSKVQTRSQAHASLTLSGIATAWSSGGPELQAEPAKPQESAPVGPYRNRQARKAEPVNRLDLVMQPDSPTGRRITRVTLAGFTSSPPDPSSGNASAGPLTTLTTIPGARPGDQTGLRPGDRVAPRGG